MRLKLQPLPTSGDELKDREKAFSYDFSYDSTDRGSPAFASQERVSVFCLLPFAYLFYVGENPDFCLIYQRVFNDILTNLFFFFSPALDFS